MEAIDKHRCAQRAGSRTFSNPVFHNLEKTRRPASSADPPEALTPQAVDRSSAFCLHPKFWMDGGIHECMDAWVDGGLDWTDGRTDGRIWVSE